MKNNIKSQILMAMVGIAILPFLSGFSLVNTAYATDYATFNNDSKDYPTLQVSNYTAAPGCTTCWSSSLNNVNPGDIVSFLFYYHNTSQTTAYNTKLGVSFNYGSSVFATGKLWADNASQITRSATINPASGRINSLTFHSYQWYPNQNSYSSQTLPNGQSGAEVTTANGVNIGNISGGWPSQGYLVVRFQVPQANIPQGDAPSVQTNSASNIRQASATLNGTVNPNGIQTNYWFEYGTTASLGENTSHSSTGSGTTDQQVSLYVGNLSNGTTYYFRLAAQNSIGTTRGSILNFRTLNASCSGASIITITPSSANVSVGQTASFSATFDPDGSCPQPSQNITSIASWSSQNSSVAASLGNGVFRGQGAGTTNIVANYNGVTNYASLSVAAVVPPYYPPIYYGNPTLAINPSYATISGNQIQTFTVAYDPDGQGGYQSSQDVTYSASWSSWNTSIAAMVGAGQFRGAGNGMTTITATYNGLVASASLTVSSFAQAQAPIIQTNQATVINQNSATLNGNVNPNGADTQAWFEYGLNTGFLGYSTNVSYTSSNTYSVSFSQYIYNLAAGTTYYFRAVARNSYGVSYGQILSFQTQGGSSIGQIPTTITSIANPVYRNSAVLNGQVNPNGGLATAWFEYGTALSLGTQTYRQPIGSGTTLIPFSLSISGLNQNTIYYFRAVSQNQYGTNYGFIFTFQTSNGSSVLPPVTKVITAATTSADDIISCVILMPSFATGDPIPGHEFEYDITYKNLCSFKLSNTVLRIFLPQEYDFLSASNQSYVRNGDGLTYTLGEVMPNSQALIAINGVVKNSVDECDALVFGAILNFNDSKGVFRSVSAYMTAAVKTVKTTLAASLSNSFHSLFGNWLFWLLLVMFIILVAYLLLSREKDGKDDKKKLAYYQFLEEMKQREELK